MSLMGAVAVGAVFFAAAWIVGGRAVPQTVASEDLLPGEGEAQLNSSGEGAQAVSSVQPAAGTQDNYVLDDGPKILPGARDTTPIHDVSLETIDQLKPLGWNLPHLTGFGLAREHAETGVSRGVRTVQVQFASQETWVNVAETRAEAEGAELIPLEEKLTGVVDDTAVQREELTLSTGDECTLYLAEGESRWTAAVDTGRVQYVITSNLPQSAAGQVAGWVMVTDRSRVQMLPPDVPSGTDRLQRGFQEILPWL